MNDHLTPADVAARLLVGERARPEKPNRIPMKGDDNSDWEAWRDACLACCHSHPEWGCIVMGVVVYTSGEKSGFPLRPGGCKRWAARDV